MRILFLECCKTSPIAVQIALPFAYLSISSYTLHRSRNFKFFFHSYQLDQLCEGQHKDVGTLISDYKADIVMIGAYTSTFHRSISLLEEAKKWGCLTIIGGLFAHDNSEYIIANYPFIDFIVTGEGEIVIFNLLNAIYYSKPLNSVPGIWYRESNKIVKTQKNLIPLNTEDFPLLDFSSIPVRRYKKALQRHYIFASRGCQYHCKYCTGSAILDRKVTFRNIEHVKYDIKLMIDHFGPMVASLADNNVTTNKEYYLNILFALKESFPELKLSVKGRVDELDDAFLNELKRLGASHICVGIETPLISQLTMLSKTKVPGSWMNLFITQIEHSSKIGFPMNINLMLATPGETEWSLQYKIRFAMDLHEKFNIKPYLSFYTPHPGGDSTRALVEDNLRIVDYNWENYDHLHPVVIPSDAPDAFIDSLIFAYNEISSTTSSELINPIITPRTTRLEKSSACRISCLQQ